VNTARRYGPDDVNNARVGGDTIEIRGRSAPDAWIDMQVQGFSSAVGLFRYSTTLEGEEPRNVTRRRQKQRYERWRTEPAGYSA
jgi:hypothetical protein